VILNLLINTYRKIVFIHDDYIFASISHIETTRNIIQEFHTSARRSKTELFKKKLGLEDIPADSVSFENLLKALRISNVYEYVLRSFDKEVIVNLIMKNLAWFIPFRNIVKVDRKKLGSTDIIEITYKCPFTGLTRTFRTVYDEEILEKIKQLCRFNEVNC